MFRWITPRWRKVLRDLWLNKNRTIVVVLSIAVGVFAVGTIGISERILSQDLQASYLATNPAAATILTIDKFDDAVVEAVEGLREIDHAEARRSVTVRVNIGPDQWRLMRLIAVPDYDEMEIDTIRSVSGAWPPPDQTILVERASFSLLNETEGESLFIKTPEGKEMYVPIAGTVHDLVSQIFVMDGMAYGYITFDTLEWLGEDRDYNELRLTVADKSGDVEHIRDVVDLARDKLEDSGSTILFAFIPQPGEHMLSFLIDAIAVIMGALGLMSLMLSGFLVINTISALVTQQTRQIGMMKAVGARAYQVMELFIGMVIIFGLLALLIAIPLGVFGAFHFSRYIAAFLNFDVNRFTLPTEVLWMQVIVGLLVPLIAASYPVIVGARVTVREAISSYGLGKGQFGTSFIDRMLVRVQNLGIVRRFITRPMLISLRNTFRRKGRLTLTLVTLVAAGAIFIAVFSVRASLMGTLDEWLDYFQYDVAVQFGRTYRKEQIERQTLRVPGVVEAEAWAFSNGRRLRPDDTDSDSIIIFAPPAETKLVNPTVVEGRWLQPDDQNAVVINTLFRLFEPDEINVGDEIILKIEGDEEPFRVVGVVTGGALSATAFVNYPYFSRVSPDYNQARWVFVRTEYHTEAYQNQVTRALETHFENVGMRVSLVAMMAQERAETEAMFNVLIVLLLLMAVLLAVIGGLGLMGTMSINVLERTREIGVMRAIGASDGAVQWIFIVEGIIIGLISWVLGAIIAYPIGYGLSYIVGQQFLNTPLSYNFSIPGLVVWLVVVIVLATVASFLPAWNASRLTVREVLAYE